MFSCRHINRHVNKLDFAFNFTPWPMAKPTTHAIGLAFENHALRFLNNDMRMALSHVGRAADGGVDLRGYWWLPKAASKKTTSDETAAKRAPKSVQPPGLAKDGTPGRRIAPLRIIGQCKAESKPQGARVVREMEGVLGHLSGLGVSTDASQ